jgi:hypothetical protein
MSKLSVREAGRRRRDPKKEAFWREALARQRHSGLGVPAFCEAEGLKATAFYFWRREIGRRDARRPRSARGVREPGPAFVELRAEAPVPGPAREPEAAIELLLSHGHRVLVRGGCDVALLGRVVAMLEGRPC